MKKLILLLALWAFSAQAGVPFSTITSTTVSNSTTETTVLGTVVGTKDLPTSLLVPGRRIRVTVGGFYSTASIIPTITIRLKLNGTTIGTATVSSPLALAVNSGFIGESWVTVRGTGASATLVTTGHVLYTGAVGIYTGAQTALITTTTPVAVDLSAATATFDCTAQFSGANVANSVTVTSFFCEID